VTGVLPVALGKATRLMPTVAHSIKEYVGIMELHGEVPEDEVRKVAGMFVGKIIQRPPFKSNVKRVPRVRRIHELEIIEVNGRHVLFRVLCDAGTYIRKLCHDMGIMLRVGAHMRELRRTRTGPFTEKDLVTLHRLSEAVYVYRTEGVEDELRSLLITPEKATCMLPKIIAKDTAVGALAHGAPLSVRGVVAYTNDVKMGSRIAVLTMKGELVLLGEALVSGRELELLGKGLAVRPIAVFMSRGVYPKAWKSKEQSKKAGNG